MERLLKFLPLIGAATTLAACQQSSHDRTMVKAEVCAMPVNGDATSAAKAALERSDYRILLYGQNGESAHMHAPGVAWSHGGEPFGPLYAPVDFKGNRCGREMPVSIDKAKSPDCCDVPETLSICGEKQDVYAAVYNREIIKSPDFVKFCGRYTASSY